MSTLSEEESADRSIGTTAADRGAPRDGNVSTLERVASVALGAVLVVFGLRRRSLGGILTLLAGGGLFYRGLSGRSRLYQAIDVNTAGGSERRETGGSSEAITVEQSITVDRPADELAELWRDPDQLSRIVGHFADLTAAGEERLHWRVAGPFDRTVSWESRIVEDRPGELLRWESTEGSSVPNEGALRFRSAPAERGTEVTLDVRFDPPGGTLTRVAMNRLDLVPRTLVAAALRRFKSLAETGEISTLERNSSARGSGDLV